ncbi:hypothetical protein [Mycoplasma sp. HU2014]|uniref:hypothetical protein n=1 Tax=Mycoplasma sp. HU2014 TaxID=1664275 RepID=UPI00067B8009|nr:hypothetical protein [Mycoplasma sp. HU2014]KNG79525.1 hypothetical protein AB668_01525 [Mycoplasma sp. HU2014]
MEKPFFKQKETYFYFFALFLSLITASFFVVFAIIYSSFALVPVSLAFFLMSFIAGVILQIRFNNTKM